MSPLVWIVLGFVAGFIASKVVNNTRQGLLVDISLDVVGAVVGGFLFNQFGEPGVSGLNLYSLVVAVVGAIPILWLYHALVERRTVVRSSTTIDAGDHPALHRGPQREPTMRQGSDPTRLTLMACRS